MLSLRSEMRRVPEAGDSVLASLDRRARTFRRAYRLKGLGGVLVVGAVALPDAIVSVEWYALLETLAGGAGGDDPGLEFRWADEADVPLLATLGRNPEDLRARMRRDDRVCIALEGDRLVGYQWFRAEAWTEHGVTVALRPDERWAYDAFVPTDRRGRRIHSALGHAAADLMQREGVVRFVSGIDHLNGPSMRSAARRGSRRLESLLVIRVLGLGLLRRSRERNGRTGWTRFRRAAGTTITLPLSQGAGAWS